MHLSPSRLAAAAREAISGELYRLGYTPKSLEETQRDVLWWVYARVQAGANLRGRLLSGWGIAWTSAGYAELVPIDVSRPGRGRVTIEVIASSVSPGTERAQFLRLPNAQVGVLGRPGYSVAGRVREVGRGVKGFRPGDLVAATGAAHASVVTAREQQVFKVPPGVTTEEASLIMLGTICLHGADLATPRSDDRVVVIGAGPIGILAYRLACRVGIPLAVIATSQRGQGQAQRSGSQLLTLSDNREAIEALGADIVIEATGDPQALGTAVAAAGVNGRVVLLGSPRGMTRKVPMEQIRQKRLRLVGAHVDTLDLVSDDPEVDARRQAGERFLQMLDDGTVRVDDLLGPPVDPRQASVFYRELAEARHSGGAYFDWRRLEARDGVRPTSLLRPPNVIGQGMEPKSAYRPRRRRPGGPFDLPSPFAGATGRLRLGLIGCGDIAVHNASGASSAPNVEISVCFDPITRLAEDLAARHDARVARTHEELLASSEVDAVFLCVPHDLHAPLAIEACEAGKPVIVEKPLANNLTDALAIRDAAERHGVWLSTCFPQRYDPKIQIARRLIDVGALGVTEGTLTRLFLDKSPAYWRGGFSGRSQSDWRRSRERAGGGVLIMNLSHHLDLMRYLSGLEVEGVSAFSRPADDVEDLLVANLRYAGGALGSLVGGSTVRGSTEEALSLWGSDGRLILEPRARVYTLRPVSGLRTTRWHSFGRLPSGQVRAVYLSRLATAASEGRRPEISADDGVAVQAVIEATYRSAAEGQVIAPDELIAEHRHAQAAS